MKQELIAGDTLDMSDANPANDNAIEVPDYPASDGWTLKYRLVPEFTTPVQAPIVLTATTAADGKRYNVQAAPAVTVLWKPGFYTWARWVEKPANTARQTLDEGFGRIRILPDPATATQPYDARSHPQKMLDSIETALEGFGANPHIKSYTIGTGTSMRTVTKTDVPDLLVLRDRYKAEVANAEAAKDIAGGKQSPRYAGIRFSRP
jgi:hypothetical protein